MAYSSKSIMLKVSRQFTYLWIITWLMLSVSGLWQDPAWFQLCCCQHLTLRVTPDTNMLTLLWLCRWEDVCACVCVCVCLSEYLHYLCDLHDSVCACCLRLCCHGPFVSLCVFPFSVWDQCFTLPTYRAHTLKQFLHEIWYNSSIITIITFFPCHMTKTDRQ